MLGVVAGLGVSLRASAQPSPSALGAEALFREARTLLEQKKWAEACAKLEASQRLDPAVGTLYSLGQCREGLEHLASAWFTYREAAALAAQRGDARRIVALQHADALEPRLAHLRLHLPSPHADLTVEVDGQPLAADAAEQPLPVDVGVHQIDAHAARGFKTEVNVPADGTTVDVEIPSLAAPPSVAPPPWNWHPAVGLGAVGVGVAALAAGSILGMQAYVKGHAADAGCPDGNGCRNATAVQDSNEAKSYADASTVLIPVGALVTVAGAYLLWTSGPSVEATAGPTAARVSVRWSW